MLIVLFEMIWTVGTSLHFRFSVQILSKGLCMQCKLVVHFDIIMTKLRYFLFLRLEFEFLFRILHYNLFRNFLTGTTEFSYHYVYHCVRNFYIHIFHILNFLVTANISKMKAHGANPIMKDFDPSPFQILLTQNLQATYLDP